ncbi:MAG: amino acid ABC transporter permease [Desulfobacteraceae bacterium]|jgi:polar amino acid transport system permease protein
MQKYNSRAAYYLWVAFFFFMVISTIGLLWFATYQIDYVWRWYNVPKYFINNESVEVKSEDVGVVDSITSQGDITLVKIKDDQQEIHTYEIKGDDIWVDEGDSIYGDDTLGAYQQWRWGILLQGAWITIKVSIYSIILGIIIGLLGGIARISSNPAVKWSAITYVELIRGSPLLVQIFIWYFVLATLVNEILKKNGLAEIPALWYGVAALACFTGAYVTEIVRAGIQSVHRGQIEAARSLGMTNTQALIYIILPQALRRILPPLAGQFISLIKDSSLLGMIAIRELTKATREAITFSLQPYEFWFMCAILYLMMTFALSMFVQYLERRMAS